MEDVPFRYSFKQSHVPHVPVLNYYPSSENIHLLLDSAGMVWDDMFGMVMDDDRHGNGIAWQKQGKRQGKDNDYIMITTEKRHVLLLIFEIHVKAPLRTYWSSEGAPLTDS